MVGLSALAWEFAEFGSDVRAIATVPRWLVRPFLLSRPIGARVSFSFMSTDMPPPWIMKFGMTR